MNWKAWLHGLAAAAISGGATAALQVIVLPHIDWRLIALGAALPVLTLLKQSPMPGGKD